MELTAPDIAAKSRPGQFVNLYTGDNAALLPRPISICRADNGLLTLVYKVVGRGTELFSRLGNGALIRVMGPLGNGFDLLPGPAVLVGGGVGIPPLLGLAKALMAADGTRDMSVYLGYRGNETFLKSDFDEICGSVCVATEDARGDVLDLIAPTNGNIYACGPRPMLKALAKRQSPAHTFLSLEERMACGTGVCTGCAVMTTGGYRRVCRDGPVFGAAELVWE